MLELSFYRFDDFLIQIDFDIFVHGRILSSPRCKHTLVSRSSPLAELRTNCLNTGDLLVLVGQLLGDRLLVGNKAPLKLHQVGLSRKLLQIVEGLLELLQFLGVYALSIFRESAIGLFVSEDRFQTFEGVWCQSWGHAQEALEIVAIRPAIEVGSVPWTLIVSRTRFQELVFELDAERRRNNPFNCDPFNLRQFLTTCAQNP